MNRRRAKKIACSAVAALLKSQVDTGDTAFYEFLGALGAFNDEGDEKRIERSLDELIWELERRGLDNK